MLAVSLYVAFRNKDPDEVTEKGVLKGLQDNNIDVSQLVEWTTDHCQEAESSTEEGSWE
jgi:predicted unusual protein kinase regulating ubiquinone biosynthesis (AarF/ABC1/UbiB family)